MLFSLNLLLAFWMIFFIAVTQRTAFELKSRSFFSVADDSDMKIIPSGKFAPTKSAEEENGFKDETLLFITQKKNGNIDKAKALAELYGKRFASGIVNPAGAEITTDENISRQSHVLCAYAVNMAAEALSPNSIIAHTILSSFYDYLREQHPGIYVDISDSAAFSLYILRGREGEGPKNAVGPVFAALCGHEGDSAYISMGEKLYEQFYSFCACGCKDAGFVDQ